jgi:hypothetical protein
MWQAPAAPLNNAQDGSPVAATGRAVGTGNR